MRYFIIPLLFSLLSFTVKAQQKALPSLKAKKIYKIYKKKEGFKDAKIPRFLLAGARLVVKNDEANTILKAIQKARVISRVDKGEGLNTKYYNDISNSISTTRYSNVSNQQKNLQIKVRKKNNKVKEMAFVTKAGPTLHYVFLKGNMKPAEAEQFISNLNKAGLGIDQIKDKIFDGLDKLLEKKDKSKQG